MVNKPIYLAASLLAILSVIAIGASANNNVFAQSDEVQATIVPGASTLTDTAYSPNPIQAKVGQEVKWTNDDSALHTVTSGTIGAPRLEILIQVYKVHQHSQPREKPLSINLMQQVNFHTIVPCIQQWLVR